jgi:uncharacterized membrane-anchored protein
MVYDRITLLRTGREIVMDVTPVDPRSLFRGDYVILSYAASRIPDALLPADAPSTRSDPLYVTLARTNGAWTPIAVAARHPGNVTDDQIVMKARLRYPLRAGSRSPGTTHFVSYGIESYFVPEGKGADLEKLVGERKLSAVIAVDKGGNAAIRALMSEGKKVYDEPLL